MKVLVITGCTKTKLNYPARAEELYLGTGHVRLMKGVRAAREAGDQVEVWVHSALHGPVAGTEVLEPYDLTWDTMDPRDRKARRGWMGHRLRALLNRPGAHDVALVALGRAYEKGADLHRCPLSAPTVRLVGTVDQAARHRPLDIPVPAGAAESRRFVADVIGVKGELARRILTRGLHRDPLQLQRLAFDLSLLET